MDTSINLDRCSPKQSAAFYQSFFSNKNSFSSSKKEKVNNVI